jgi:hypothetical protein
VIWRATHKEHSYVTALSASGCRLCSPVWGSVCFAVLVVGSCLPPPAPVLGEHLAQVRLGQLADVARRRAFASDTRALAGQKWPSRSNPGIVPAGVKTPVRRLAERPTTRTCRPTVATTTHRFTFFFESRVT